MSQFATQKEVNFLIGGEIKRYRTSELDHFRNRLVQARYEYYRVTGKPPTHLILGQNEWAQYNAMIEIREWPDAAICCSGRRKMQFYGLDILMSHEPELLLAAELPVPK